jgi:hypothetical protein
MGCGRVGVGVRERPAGISEEQHQADGCCSCEAQRSAGKVWGFGEHVQVQAMKTCSG